MKCKDCYWFEQCGSSDPCSDYMPLDDSIELMAYVEDLDERAKEYEATISSLK